MPNRQEPSASAPGLGLRTKLVLGFVGLLAILIAVGVESISLLSELGGSIDVILRENYASVLACDRMKEALERLDSAALFALAGETQKGRELAAENRPRFAAALQAELGNITETGEGERAARLRQLYNSYVPALERVLAAETPDQERHALYFSRVLPVFQQIKTNAEEILELNQQSMVAARDHARRLAAEAGRSMAILLLAGTAFAGLCVFFLSRAILGPLERLTRAARRIEGGDLDLTVPVASRDELGQLAAAFNSMAGGLRDLRESDQARLLRGQRGVQAAADDLSEAVVVLANDRQVTLANRAAASFLGVHAGQALPARHDEWLLPLLDRVKTGQPQEHLPASGIRLPSVSRERFFLPRAAILRDAQGRPEGFVLVVEDVTGQHRTSEVHAGLLKNAARDLERALAPLQVERLRQIAANLDGISLQQGNRGQLHLEPMASDALIEAAVVRVAEAAQDGKVKLVTGVASEEPRVLADPERAGLVLFNLLKNAVAHTPEGGSVTVSSEPEKGRTRFTVTDTGRGIPPAHREPIFEPLYQVPGTEDLGGAGLGLAMARNIVQAHGGEIGCDSEEGRGTTFWFTLPAGL